MASARAPRAPTRSGGTIPSRGSAQRSSLFPRCHTNRLLAGGVLAGALLLVASCTGDTGATTTTRPASAAPPLTADRSAELQVRAMRRALAANQQLCVSAEASAELRTAIAEGLPSSVEYFDNRDDLKTGEGSEYRCVVVTPLGPRSLASGVLGIDVWVMRGDLEARADTYLFRWDGTQWVDTNPDETEITTTTAVS